MTGLCPGEYIKRLEGRAAGEEPKQIKHALS